MLRKLELKDAEGMLEWMHDEEVLKSFQADLFRNRTIEDCREFIKECETNTESLHMAIVDENDDYQGTISLKLISEDYGDAEFAIVLRTDAQGKGYARQAMKDVMDIAFNELGLKEVYWNVLKDNEKAIKLYESLGCKRLTNVSERRLNRAPEGMDVFFYVWNSDM